MRDPEYKIDKNGNGAMLGAQFRKIIISSRFLFRDGINSALYGTAAPKSCELIYARVENIQKFTDAFSTYDSGRIVSGNWDRNLEELSRLAKIRFCERRWLHGDAWKATGILDHGNKKTKTLERYGKLDQIFLQVQQEGVMLPHSVVEPPVFREFGGILIHIGAQCEPIFGCSGYHRMAIAKISGIDFVPAQLGVVHAKALETWREIYCLSSRNVLVGLDRIRN